MLGAPARAVPGHDEPGSHPGECSDGGLDDGPERGAAEMQAAHQSVQGRHAGQPLRVPHDVDGAGVPAAGQDHQALAPDVDHEGLVVEDQRVVLPR